MATELSNRHADLSRRLLEQANYELDQKGDRVQASEKASGAVAQAVKAIAEDRQWRHSSHALRRTIVNLLVAEFNQPGLDSVQAIADQLHNNYYEDRLYDWELRSYLDQIESGIVLFWEIWERGANSDFVPSPPQQAAIDRLRISEAEAATQPLLDYPPPMPPFVPPER